MPARPKRPANPDWSVQGKLRRYRIAKAKLAYDLACLPDDSDDADADRVVAAADKEMEGILVALGTEDLTDLDDAIGVLCVARDELRDGPRDMQTVLELIEAVRNGLHRRRIATPIAAVAEARKAVVQ